MVTNPYRKEVGNEFDNLMLKLLDYDLDELQFEKLRNDMLNKIGAKDVREF